MNVEVYKIGRATYKVGESVTIHEMTPQMSISDLLSNTENKQVAVADISACIIAIAGKYLMLNAKGKGITNEYGFKLIAEFIIQECKNLEIQEIEYIFKKGVMGRFGEIYNDISIDTICGKNGWIETYYKTDRKQKPEKIEVHESERFSGAEMSVEQFYKKNPEFAKRKRLTDICELAKGNKAKMVDIKEFYKLKDLTLNDLKDDLEALSKIYYELAEEERKVITWDMYLSYWIQNFILNNIYKSKS